MMYLFVFTLCGTFVASSLGLFNSSTLLKSPPRVTIVSLPFSAINLTWTFKYTGNIPTIQILTSPEIKKKKIYKQIKQNIGIVTVEVVEINKTSKVENVYLQLQLKQTRWGRTLLLLSTVALQIVSVKSTSKWTTTIRTTSIKTTSVRSTLVRSATFCSSVLKTSVRSNPVGSNSVTSFSTTSCSSVSHRDCSVSPEEDDRVKTEADKVMMKVYIALIFIAVLFFTFTVIICVSVVQMRGRISDQRNEGNHRIEIAQTGMNLPEIECPQ